MTKKPAKPAPNATDALKLHTAVQKLSRQGKSIKAIAKELHKSDRTIAAIVNKTQCDSDLFMSIGRPHNVGSATPECKKQSLEDAVCALRSKGLSIKAIAKKLHKSDKKIAAIVKKTGIGAPANKKPAKKPLPPKGVPGFDVIKIELNKDQQFALFVAAHIMELADEINKVIAKVFNKGH